MPSSSIANNYPTGGDEFCFCSLLALGTRVTSNVHLHEARHTAATNTTNRGGSACDRLCAIDTQVRVAARSERFVLRRRQAH
jgi:hypothetical protein